MGARAQEAVTWHSQQTDINLLRLLGILAAGADDDTGLIDPAPRRDTLAEITGVTPRTISNRIRRLIDSGELVQERAGHGPGNPSAYRLALPIPAVTAFKEMVKNGESLANKVAALELRVAEIEAHIFTIFHQLETIIERLNGEKWGNDEGEMVKMVKGNGESLPEKEGLRSFRSITSTTVDVDPKEGEGDPPPARAREDGRYHQDLWQKTITLIQNWTDFRGIYEALDPAHPDHRADYFAPGLKLLDRVDGDLDRARQLVWDTYHEMLADGLTPRRLRGVVAQVLARLDREQMPARASPEPAAKLTKTQERIKAAIERHEHEMVE